VKIKAIELKPGMVFCDHLGTKIITFVDFRHIKWGMNKVYWSYFDGHCNITLGSGPNFVINGELTYDPTI